MVNGASKLNIRHDILSCEKIYDADKAWAELHARSSVEIGMVTAGSGIHLVLDQAIPCQVGDIFVTPADIPHRYFIENEGECLRVRRLRFSIDEGYPYASACQKRYMRGYYDTYQNRKN